MLILYRVRSRTFFYQWWGSFFAWLIYKQKWLLKNFYVPKQLLYGVAFGLERMEKDITQALNCDRYNRMITNVFGREIEDVDLENMCGFNLTTCQYNRSRSPILKVFIFKEIWNSSCSIAPLGREGFHK